jgi:phage gpG-like protein
MSVVGDDEWKRRLRLVRPDIGREFEAAVQRGLLKIEGSAKKRLDYDVLNRQTSTLFRSVNHRMARRGLDSYGEVGTHIVYGPIHEYGKTITNAFGRGITVKIPKRPWLTPSFEEHRARILSDMQAAIRKGLNATGL